jgi:hypothetical protein
MRAEGALIALVATARSPGNDGFFHPRHCEGRRPVAIHAVPWELRQRFGRLERRMDCRVA